MPGKKGGGGRTRGSGVRATGSVSGTARARGFSPTDLAKANFGRTKNPVNSAVRSVVGGGGKRRKPPARGKR